MNQNDDPLLQHRASNDPYKTAAALIVRRLIWDIQPESWASRRKIRAWKNRFKGEKAVILCNGPSLLKTDLSLLDSVFTFGLNKINLLFDKSDFRPSCIVAVNAFVIEQNASFYNKTNIPLFLDSLAIKHIKPKDSVIYLHSSHHHVKFARDCSISIYQGNTVTNVALQLAFHMGFEHIALVGCDHSFAAKGPANKIVIAKEKDESHFDPNYFSGGVKWQLPDLYQSEVSYVMAKRIYEASGRSIVNSTVGGSLDVFDRLELKDFINA